MINWNKIVENPYEIPFYKNLRKRIISYLYLKKSASLDELLEEVGGSLRRVLRLLKEMRNNNELSFKNKKILIKKIFYLNKQKINKIIKKYVNVISKINFVPTFLFDQRPITLQSKLRKVLYAWNKLDISCAKKIAVLGDDDFISPLISCLNSKAQVDVFDIDNDVLTTLMQIKRKLSLKNINLFKYDLSKKPPKWLRSSYDLFFTDPTPTPSPFRDFIKFAYTIVKDRGVGYLSFYPSHSPLTLEFQKILNDYGMIITEMLPKTTKYEIIDNLLRQEDKLLLKKLRSQSFSKEPFSFHENLTRVIVFKSKISQKINSIPNAVKRIIKNPKCDPRYGKIPKNKLTQILKKYDLKNKK